MFTKKDDLIDTKGFSKSKTNMFTISRYPANRNNESNSSKNKAFPAKSSNIPDFSLNTLTKEL